MKEGRTYTTKKRTLAIRITDIEREKLESIAREKGYTLGETIRYLIRKYNK